MNDSFGARIGGFFARLCVPILDFESGPAFASSAAGAGVPSANGLLGSGGGSSLPRRPQPPTDRAIATAHNPAHRLTRREITIRISMVLVVASGRSDPEAIDLGARPWAAGSPADDQVQQRSRRGERLVIGGVLIA